MGSSAVAADGRKRQRGARAAGRHGVVRADGGINAGGVRVMVIEDEFCVNLFLSGYSIDGVANEVYLLLKSAYKDGLTEDKPSKKEARRIAETAIYKYTMGLKSDRNANQQARTKKMLKIWKPRCQRPCALFRVPAPQVR